MRHDETRARVEQIARYARNKYKVKYAWRGNQLHLQHKGSSVAVYLGDGCIELKVKLGLLFVPMKGKIEKAIRKNLHSTIGDRKGAPDSVTLYEKV